MAPGGIQQPQRIAPRRAAARHVADRSSQQRRRSAQPLVIAGLVRQVTEQVPELTVGEPDPPVLDAGAQQHLHCRQADQLGIG
jgi:hypothetical protein